VWLTEREQIDAARAAQAGGTARIPNGRVVSGTQVNTGWNRHLEDVSFAESAIELFDGRRSDVGQQGTASGVAVTAGGLSGLSISPRGRLGVNWNEFSARRYRGRTFQNAVTPTALNVARSLDLCCVQ
jgi:hypothetical protein